MGEVGVPSKNKTAGERSR